MAPTGSSSLSRDSTNSALSTTRTPATAPIKTANGASTNAQGAVIATRPASMPLHIMVTSGLPNLLQTYAVAATAPAAEASNVFTATTAVRVSIAAKVEPALKPNQPN